MCEFLVRIVPRVPTGDKTRDDAASQVGDVISLHEDGWGWGDEEVKSEIWQLVKLPGVPAKNMADYMREDRNLATGELLRWRSTSFDLAFVDTIQTAKTEAKAQDKVEEIYIATTIEVDAARIDKAVAEIGVVG